MVEQKETKKTDDNVVFIGKKPTMSYVLAVITQFSSGAKEVHVKARGKSISRAVDVVEVIKKRFMPDIKYSIDIGTEEMKEEDKTVNISTIDILLKK